MYGTDTDTDTNALDRMHLVLLALPPSALSVIVSAEGVKSETDV